MTDETTTPRRIQRKRTKGWTKPEGAISVARPSQWGNPFRIGQPFRFVENGELVIGVVGNHEAAVKLFRRYIDARPDHQEMIRAELAGKTLMCWCPEGQPCHADVLLEVANGARR